jgi:hypothetical protein
MYAKCAALFLLLPVISACSPQIPTITATPAAMVWRIQYSTSMKTYVPFFFACTMEQTGLQILTEEVVNLQQSQPPFEFSLHWGDLDQVSGYATVIGHDEWVVVVNAGNPLEQVSFDTMQQLFQGMYSNWEDLALEGYSYSGPLQVWGYVEGVDIQDSFKAASGVDLMINPFTKLAPNPEALLLEIANDPGAIGILPASWVDNTVKKITVSGLPSEAFTVPIVAVSAAEPTGEPRAWLACLQDLLP